MNRPEKIPARRLLSAVSIVLLGLLLPGAAGAVTPARIDYVLSDVRVLFLTDEIESVDWPTIYYLNGEFGCRVDVVRIEERAAYRAATAEVPEHQLYLHTFYLPPGEDRYIDSVQAALFGDRLPDIVLLSAESGGDACAAVRRRITSLEPSTSRWFDILKIYRHAEWNVGVSDTVDAVVLNGRELATRYGDRMKVELPQLLDRRKMEAVDSDQLIRYVMLSSRLAGARPDINFLSGIPQNRLVTILDELLPRGPKKLTMVRQAREFQSALRAARFLEGREQVESIIEGYRSLYDLVTTLQDDPLLEARTDLRYYVDHMLARAERLALSAAGVRWDGRIIVRDSPHGPKVKFRAALSADGPREIELLRVLFHPYWDTVTVPLDTATHRITPHQSFVREYLVEIDRGYLRSQRPDSLIFTAEIAYGPLPMTVRNALPVWQRTNLDIAFEPDFYFVPPVAELDIDRVVSPMNLRVVIAKPPEFAGNVKLNLETPRGLYAGAYRQDLRLEAGKTRETVRIPFSISKLFELGLQRQTISLEYGNRPVAVDTALVRIASCHIDDKIQVAFLPDTTGLLEDILNMTDAAFRPLTDRGLVTAALNAYDVILVGSGAFRGYPSFPDMKDRFEDFIRNGGSLVIMGQPEDWPEGVLPVSFVPGIELVAQAEITNRIEGANILSRPYRITESGLLSSFYKPRDVAAAVVAPSERVFVTPTGATLLSVSRLGEGQIIYCGLPLLDMVSRLDIDAIHLFANILNY